MNESQRSIEYYESVGAQAYISGKSKGDNPFKPLTEQFNAWNHGFDCEKNYWETLV